MKLRKNIKVNKQNRLTVIDFFCGAGGFSEGFRRAGYDVVMGIDSWEPAIKTHNFNHNLNDVTKSVLDFEDIKEIEKLPDTDVIIGSPPCQLFSISNRGGNAEKT
ncbi:TPA: DNA cytosine methyltransferase, partial [Streptococcus suis]|nr:DNA cytosine methyltransferase [Streptococcus suis]